MPIHLFSYLSSADQSQGYLLLDTNTRNVQNFHDQNALERYVQQEKLTGSPVHMLNARQPSDFGPLWQRIKQIVPNSRLTELSPGEVTTLDVSVRGVIENSYGLTHPREIQMASA